MEFFIGIGIFGAAVAIFGYFFEAPKNACNIAKHA